MSRSYKKTAWLSWTKKDSDYKRIYNKRIRRIPIDSLVNYGGYKKYNCPWNIQDLLELDYYNKNSNYKNRMK